MKSYFEVQYEIKSDPKPPKTGRWQIAVPVPRTTDECCETLKKLLVRDDWIVIHIRKVQDE